MKKKASKPLTPDEKEKLLKLYRDGAPIRELAEKFKRREGTIGMIISRAVKKGLVKPRQKGPLPKPEGKAVYKTGIRTVLFLDEEVNLALKISATLTRKSMSEIAGEALRKHLAGLKIPSFFETK